MQISPDAIVSRSASIEVAASPEVLYNMVADVTRVGEWSPETVGAQWLDGGGGKVGDWFEGQNRSGEREWNRRCQVAAAEPGRDFTFVVDGVEANCTWWSYEMEPLDAGRTRLTERWWLVNKTPGVAAMTPEQFEGRVALTETMLGATLAALKQAAES